MSKTIFLSFGHPSDNRLAILTKDLDLNREFRVGELFSDPLSGEVGVEFIVNQITDFAVFLSLPFGVSKDQVMSILSSCNSHDWEYRPTYGEMEKSIKGDR